jgi:hypothetical protein
LWTSLKRASKNPKALSNGEAWMKSLRQLATLSTEKKFDAGSCDRP